MKIGLKSVLKTIFSAFIGISILYYIWHIQSVKYTNDCIRTGGVDCELSSKLFADLQSASLTWMIMVCVIYLVSNVLRAFRWKILLDTLSPNIRFVNVLCSIMIAYFANLALARLGEFLQVGAIAKYEDQKYEEVFGTLIFERIIDAIALLIFIGLGITLSYDSLEAYLLDRIHPDLISNKVGILSILAIAGAIFLYLLYRVPIKGRTVYQRFSVLFDGLKKGFLSFWYMEQKLQFILYTAGVWTCYYLMMYGSFLMFDYSRGLRAVDALMVSVCGSLGAILPTPGGVGGYHAMVMEGMMILGVSSSEAISFAMITYVLTTFLCAIIFGVISLVTLLLYNRS